MFLPDVLPRTDNHYAHPCFKKLIAIDFMGHIVYSCPEQLHSTAFDAHTMLDVRHDFPVEDGELFIGDCHFSTFPNCITPIKKPPQGNLTGEELQWNACIQLVRARIEHVNSVIKGHAMFKQAFRGTCTRLNELTNITLHATAVLQNLRPPRYAGYGPLPHFPVGGDIGLNDAAWQAQG